MGSKGHVVKGIEPRHFSEMVIEKEEVKFLTKAKSIWSKRYYAG
jgi:hypothetical protein